MSKGYDAISRHMVQIVHRGGLPSVNNLFNTNLSSANSTDFIYCTATMLAVQIGWMGYTYWSFSAGNMTLKGKEIR